MPKIWQTKKVRHKGSFPLSYPLWSIIKQPSGWETEPWPRQCGRNLPQKATPRAGSLGRPAGAAHGDRRVHSGPAHNQALVPGRGAGCSLGPLIPRQEQASFLPYNVEADGKTDLGRQRDTSPDSGCSISGNGSTLLNSCHLRATSPACICPLEYSLTATTTPFRAGLS